MSHRVAVLLLALTAAGRPVVAEGIARVQTLSFGTGWFDFNRQRNEALEARIEYRLKSAKRPLRGIAVAMLTGDSSVFLGSGMGWDVALGQRWFVTPSFVPGYYRRADGKDLGLALEFRSQLELGYAFRRGSRLSVAISHLSNAGLGSRNPGQESLAVAIEIPLTRRR